ncbi:putative glycoside hydrolase [Actinomyces marmotae]|uniref:putative glycoside hydrolase n=1 Tax=Actinomyces marmotae TaxID=2737173 RepID=UPI001356C2F4|nr:putative glycoside hydrolase [Actinomyces marmotae]
MTGVGAWIRYGGPLQAQDVEEAARHYRAAILQPWETAAAARLKELAPHMTVLAYQCLSSTRDFEPPERLASGIAHAEAARHGWHARRRDGSLIEWDGYPGHFQAAVWDPDYRRAWVERVRERIAPTAFDGVMADNDVFDDYYGLGLPIEGADDPAALRDSLGMLVDEAGAALAGIGRILVPNIAEARREPGRWERHSAWGGGFDECWLGWGDDSFLDATAALAQAHQLTAPGLTIVRAPSGGAGAPRALYGLAAFWVLGGGRGAFASTGHDDYSRLAWMPALDADLGAPLGPPRHRGLLWRRDFERGVAIVNLDGARGARPRLPVGLVAPGPRGGADGAPLPRRPLLGPRSGLIALRP